jgi:hypothetical protein
MNIDIPEGKDAIGYVWGEMVPGIGIAASKFSLAVYATPPWAARVRGGAAADRADQRVPVLPWTGGPSATASKVEEGSPTR